jgi:hypothetical protein
MRNTSVDGEAGSAAATEFEGGPAEDKTTTVSVATLRRLRRLAAQSAKDRAEQSTDTPDPGPAEQAPSSPPSFFAKSGAVLVIPETKSAETSEPQSEARDPHPEAPASDPTLVSRVTPARSAFRPKATALLSNSERQARTNQALARSSMGRLVTLALSGLLAFILVGKLWGWNVGGVRDRVAARAPAVKVLLDWGSALLSE